nr:MAG TPA: hypothetical protein [Caudoviricetes sp.]
MVRIIYFIISIYSIIVKIKYCRFIIFTWS